MAADSGLHGDADRTVVSSNAEATVDQWRGIHGVERAPDRVDLVDGHRHRSWNGVDGRIAVEEYIIAGMGHGTPLKTIGADRCGNAGAHMLEAGISSTWIQAASWGLIGAEATVRSQDGGRTAPKDRSPVATATAPAPASDGSFLSVTIEGALRSAGLLR